MKYKSTVLTFAALAATVFSLLTACKTTAPGRKPSSELSLNSALHNCEFCRWLGYLDKASELDHPVDKALLCEDPYRALSNGQLVPAYAELNKQWKEKGKSAKSSAISAYTQKFDTYDSSTVFLEELRKSGLVVTAEDAKKYFESKFAGGDHAELKLSNVKYCEDEKAGWSLSHYDAKNKDARIPALTERRQKFLDRWKAEIKGLVRMSPVLFLERIAKACTTLKASVEKIDSESKSELADHHAEYLRTLTQLPACKNPLEIRQMAAAVMRREEVRWTEEEATKLSDIHFPLLFTSTDLSNIKNFLGPEIGPETQKFVLESEKYSSVCSELTAAGSSRIEEAGEELERTMVKSKAYLGSLIQEFYSSWDKEKYMQAFEWARKGVFEGLPAVVKDPVALQAMRASIAQVKFVWPDINEFKFVQVKNWSGKDHEVLDESQIPASSHLWWVLRFVPAPIFNAMFDPVGRRVVITPGTAWFFKKAPMSMVEVLAHEIGHDLDPENARDPALSEAVFGSALKCMSGKESIMMKKDQWTEGAADIVATLSISHLLNLLPPENRAAYAAQSLMFSPMASFEESDYDFVEAHSFDTYRVNGIFGSSSVFRAAQACQNPPAYKTCF